MKIYRNFTEILKQILKFENEDNVVGQIDNETMDNFLRKHKFYSYVYKNNIRLNATIKNCSEQYFRSAKDELNTDISIIRTIQKELSNDELIVFKGIVPYMLTGDDSLLKCSNDIDIILRHPTEFSKLIVKIGGLKTTRSCSAHEEGKYFYKDRKIEAHYVFPGIKIPDNPLSTTRGLTNFNIEYEDIYKESEVVQGIRIPNMEMTVFMLAVHMYKDFYWQPYKFPRVRLYDLYAIHNLANHEQFWTDKFQNIVNKFEAWEIISFAKTAIDNYFMDNVFDKCGKMISKSEPYLKIMNCDHSVYISSTYENYFELLPVMEFQDVVMDLSPNMVNMDTYVSSINLKKYIFSEDGVHNFPFNFKFNLIRVEEDVEVNFELEYGLEERDSIYIGFKNNSGHYRHHVNCEPQVFGLHNNSEYNVQVCKESTYISYLFKGMDEEVLRAGAIISVERCINGSMLKLTLPIIIQL